MRRLVLIFFSVLLFHPIGYSQIDSIRKEPSKNMVPVYLSAVLPGAGQIYNGKWWKVPIIYAGLAGTYYLYANLDYQYHVLLQDVVTLQNGYPYTMTGITDISTLKSTKDQFRNWRDLTGIGFSLVWILNVVDAYVDAEFMDFDVSPDLSLNGSMLTDPTSRSVIPGISVRVRF